MWYRAVCVCVVDLRVYVSVCECVWMSLYIIIYEYGFAWHIAAESNKLFIHESSLRTYVCLSVSVSLSLRTSFSVCPYVCVFIWIWSLVKAKSFVLLRLSLCLHLSLSVSSSCYASRSACGLVLGQLSELMQSGRTTIKAKNDDRTANWNWHDCNMCVLQRHLWSNSHILKLIDECKLSGNCA